MQFNWQQDISEWIWVINVGETELWRRKDGPAEAYFGIFPCGIIYGPCIKGVCKK